MKATQSAGDMTLAAERMGAHMRAAGFPAEDIVVVEAGKAKKVQEEPVAA